MPTNQTGAEMAQDTAAETTNQRDKQIADVGEEKRTETATGFAPFRAWFNDEIRRMPNGVNLHYGGTNYAVTELTNDGQLRLQIDDRAVLIPFDSRYIPLVLKQIL